MSWKQLTLILLLAIFTTSANLAAENPIVDVISATTGTVIEAKLLTYIPGHTFDFKSVSMAVPNVLITGLTQKTPNSSSLFLFNVNENETIQRATVNITPTGFQAQPFQKFGLRLTEFYPALQLTQFRNPLALGTFNDNEYRAYFLNARGLYAHRGRKVFPTVPGAISISSGISADGAFTWKSGQVNGSNFYGIQHLTGNYQMTGRPLLVDIPRPIISGDITGELPGGQRLFIYRELGTPSNNQFPSRIAIQKFDSFSLQPIGNPYAITKFRFTPFGTIEDLQSVAADPLGTGVAFTRYSKACNKELLQFRVLDNQFRPLGKIKTLLACNDLKDSQQGAYGLDIMPFHLQF